MQNPFDPNERETRGWGHVPPRPIPPRLERDPCERTDQREADVRTKWTNIPYTEADRLADLRLIQAGLAPWPTKPKSRRVRAVLLLKKLCSSLGLAVAVFALCFAATTLALRLAPLQAPTPSVASPVIDPVGMPGAYKSSKVRP